MDNITHSLVGVALADLSMGRRGTKAQRPLFVGAGIIAANLPDIDLAYSWITPRPIGYLLHHRGHTHTIAGHAVLACALLAAYWFFPTLRKMRFPGRLRFWLLIAIALASHLALDSLNSYGVHPYYPFDNKWYYGDALFIVEPSLWVVLGVAALWNARTRTASRAAALTRTAVALAMSAAIVAGFMAASRVARGAAVQALGTALRGDLLDVILTPNPLSPLCWEVIAIELRERGGEYVLWRGTLSLSPAWKAPTGCASHRFRAPPGARMMGDGRLALRDEIHQPLRRLRALAERDCWVRAWLRFGRAPVMDGESIVDLRFSDRPGREFTEMRLAPRDGCPPHVPGWGMPRADLLR